MSKGCTGCRFLETWNKQFKSKCFREWNTKRLTSVTSEVLDKGCKHKINERV